MKARFLVLVIAVMALLLASTPLTADTIAFDVIFGSHGQGSFVVSRQRKWDT